MLALQAENRVAVNGCVATGFNLWDYEGISDHRPRENVKQCGNLFSDEMPPNLVLTNNAGCDVVCFQFGLSLSRTGFSFFPTAGKRKQKEPPLTNKKLKTVFISLKFSKLLPLVVGQGKFFNAPFHRFS